ncbi:tetratricopeptide repeat protein [Anaerobium acetethylicum]|uniref:Tetratricopeptide repeat-containing protein n=1 Tax=Anaerobium acetethylicum TaxID=1619234 RepID=A0A1D3TSZ9_9FIRM|nr:tetratricopeptide repeat protein [Anaerobium acetethylicum]SCP97064.1 Tetratricopeptide repeat-containing protein [Anaerobium acetethylicum]
MSIIEKFLDYYTKKADFYRESAKICAQICETNMEQMGIRGIVTSRAKKVERLRDKLEKRSKKKNYCSLEDITEDIIDLAGVRIALYFPGDLKKVQNLIESTFQIIECKVFPEFSKYKEDQGKEYKKRFSGYWATHYRVYLKESDLSGDLMKYSNTIIEIQIASALMHAWAEVEHDLVYKPFSGELSYEEYQILDELNGLILAGEIALERLQKAVKNRVSQAGQEFNNHYELAMFLYNRLGSASDNPNSEAILGRVDLLYNCLKYTRYNKPENLMEILSDIDPDIQNSTIVDQLIEKMGKLNPALYESFFHMKQGEELKYQLETLRMNRENGNRQGEANTLANIGYLYLSKENYDEATSYFTKSVEINHEIGGIQGEANQLLNLGSSHRLKGDLDKSLEFCDSALALHMRINYKQGQANALGMIGNIFSDKGDFDRAAGYYKDALAIYKETSYKIGEATQLSNLGSLFFKQNDLDIALGYCNRSIGLYSECDYKQGEADTLCLAGKIYLKKNMPDEALIYFKKALSIQEDAGSQKNKTSTLMMLGKIYKDKGDCEQALHFYNEALIISRNIGYKNGESEALKNIEFLN